MSTASLPPDPVESPAFIVRYAETDDDVIAMHKFILVVAEPIAVSITGKSIDPVKTLMEMLRITKHDVSIMLIVDGMLVGILGLMKATWWYNDAEFLTDRWHFVLPEFAHTEGAKALKDEAIKIAKLSGLKFIHQGKIRQGKDGVQMMPRMYGE